MGIHLAVAKIISVGVTVTSTKMCENSARRTGTFSLVTRRRTEAQSR